MKASNRIRVGSGVIHVHSDGKSLKAWGTAKSRVSYTARYQTEEAIESPKRKSES